MNKQITVAMFHQGSSVSRTMASQVTDRSRFAAYPETSASCNCFTWQLQEGNNERTRDCHGRCDNPMFEEMRLSQGLNKWSGKSIQAEKHNQLKLLKFSWQQNAIWNWLHGSQASGFTLWILTKSIKRLCAPVERQLAQFYTPHNTHEGWYHWAMMGDPSNSSMEKNTPPHPPCYPKWRLPWP